MTANGTERYAELDPTDVPELVLRAVTIARRLGFPLSVHPSTGRLLAALAGGLDGGLIGETGTGTGAGVAWMLSTMSPDTRIVSIELDAAQAAAAAELFADHPNVTILHGEANELAAYGPFDLLVLDTHCDPGPLHWQMLDPTTQLRPNGLLFKDDLWPMTSWPPLAFDGSVDERRRHWLEHPNLLATEVTVAEGFSVLLGRRRPAQRSGGSPHPGS